MTTIWYERDADMSALDGARVAVVGYGNQGRSWALNLRDSGVETHICVRADATRDATRPSARALLNFRLRRPAAAGARGPRARSMMRR